jgi:hypothetical protein
MEPEDVPDCVKIVAAHPALGPRYGANITDLGTAWLRLLNSDTFCCAHVFEEMDGSRKRMLGAGVSVFVHDDFLREVKTPPLFWIGPELAKRITRRRAPLLSTKELRNANSSAGLNLFVWQCGVHPDDNKRPEVGHAIVTTFIEHHSGYRLKEFIQQAESADHLRVMCNGGGLLLNTAGGLYSSAPTVTDDIVSAPHIVGLTRELALRQPACWVGSLFIYVTPQFAFTAGEQRLVILALKGGGTDEELATALSISLSAVKKKWRSIYSRAAIGLPELRSIPMVAPRPDRGKDKKHRLLVFLREHPEELRPVSRKLLQQWQQSADSSCWFLKSPREG